MQNEYQTPTGESSSGESDNIKMEYKRKRAEENRPRILFTFKISASIFSAITAFCAMGVAIGGEAWQPLFITLFITLGLLGGVVVLRFTTFGEANPEECAAVLATVVLSAIAFFFYLYFDDLRTTLDKCNQLNLTLGVSTVGKNLSDVTNLGLGLTGDYCVDVIKWAAGDTFNFCYGLWITFAMVFVLLFRLRFRLSMAVAGVPGLILMITSNYFMFTMPTDWSPGAVVSHGMFITYLPGLLVCTLVPFYTEKLHFAAFILNREKDMRLRKQSTRIRDQSKEIAKTKELLAEAQEVVDEVMAQGGTVLDQYAIPYSDLTMGDSLGEGSFGTVYKATLTRCSSSGLGITVAVKTMRVEKVTKTFMDKFRGEIYIMAPLVHPNLVRLYGAVWNEGPEKLCIVLEYVENGSLLDVLNPESDCAWANTGFHLALGTATCLRYLHHELPEPVIHRDIKPDNVLVGGDGLTPKARVELGVPYNLVPYLYLYCVVILTETNQRQRARQVADFGESKQFHHAEDRKYVLKHGNSDSKQQGERNAISDELVTMTVTGTPLYMAPEILNGNRLVLLEVALRDGFYVKKHFRGRLSYMDGGRPPIPTSLREERPKLVEIIEESWVQDPRMRLEFRELVPRLQNLHNE